MEPESSQDLATFPYSEPVQSSPRYLNWFFAISIKIFSSHLRLDFSRRLSPSGFPTRTLYAPNRRISLEPDVFLSTLFFKIWNMFLSQGEIPSFKQKKPDKIDVLYTLT